MKPINPHDSMRGHFFWNLYDEIAKDKRIILICVDLGYGAADAIRQDFPEQFIQTPASEQAAMGIAVGLALQGKIPLVYSITPFLVWRPAETIRLYLNHENVNVKLVGSGRNDDYGDDGYSHDATDTEDLLNNWENIQQFWARDGEDIKNWMHEFLYNGKPSFISLKRKW